VFKRANPTQAVTNRVSIPSFLLSIGYSFPPCHVVLFLHFSNNLSNLCPPFSNTFFFFFRRYSFNL
jgi:hypothetical protein